MIHDTSPDGTRIDDEAEPYLPEHILEYGTEKVRVVIQEGEHALQFSGLKAFGE
jgi:hypothetical protein